ncbi:MAG: hypothetical protein ACOX6S_06820 [Clostridia bacterium]
MKVKGFGLYKTLITIHERFILAIQETEKKLREAAEAKVDSQEYKEGLIEENKPKHIEASVEKKEEPHKNVPGEGKVEVEKEAAIAEKVEERKEGQKEEVGPERTEAELVEKTDEKLGDGNPEMPDVLPLEESRQESLSYQALLVKLNEAADRIRSQGSHGLEIVMSEGLFGQTVQMELSAERLSPPVDHESWQQTREIRAERADAGSTAKKERETYILMGREVCRLLEEMAAKIANHALAVDGRKVDIPLDGNLAYTVKYEDNLLEGKLSIVLSWIKDETTQ